MGNLLLKAWSSRNEYDGVSVERATKILDALRPDLVGPEPKLGNNTEVLDRNPSRWYLTGFLVPTEAGEEQKKDEELRRRTGNIKRGRWCG